jgi:hypothetical protein
MTTPPTIPGYEHLSQPSLTYDQIVALYKDRYISRDTLAAMVREHAPEKYTQIKSRGVWKVAALYEESVETDQPLRGVRKQARVRR